MPTVQPKLRLPFLEIGFGDIKITMPRKAKEAGPFMIVSRACGMALDTAFSVELGSYPILYPPHGRPHQLWGLGPSSAKGEVQIRSAESGLALDSTRTMDGNDVHPVLWESHGEPWQRWRLERSPDGLGFLIASAHSRRYLTASEDAEPKWMPWFADRAAEFNQQWLLAMPHTTPAA